MKRHKKIIDVMIDEKNLFAPIVVSPNLLLNPQKDLKGPKMVKKAKIGPNLKIKR